MAWCSHPLEFWISWLCTSAPFLFFTSLFYANSEYDIRRWKNLCLTWFYISLGTSVLFCWQIHTYRGWLVLHAYLRNVLWREKFVDHCSEGYEVQGQAREYFGCIHEGGCSFLFVFTLCPLLWEVYHPAPKKPHRDLNGEPQRGLLLASFS